MSQVAQMHFFGPINISAVESLRNMLLNALQSRVTEIKILMSSEGGDLNSGFTAYNYIRSMPVKTRCINMGTIESISVMPFLAATERRAVENSRFLLHDFSWTFKSAPVNINKVSECADSLKFDTERYAKTFDERTSGCESPIDISAHLTGASCIIGPSAAILSGITTTADTGLPNIIAGSPFFDRLFK